MSEPPTPPPGPDFRLLFESAPGLYLVLAPDLTIVAVSEAYLGATSTQRETILGRGIFEVFPDNPDDPTATGVANLCASLERVLATKRPDAMAVQKYDIRVPSLPDGGFEERFWSPRNAPVLAKDGALAYIIHRVEDVTEFVRLRQHDTELGQLNEELHTRAGQMEAEIYRRAQEIQQANTQLRELQAELEQRVQVRTKELVQACEDLERESEEHLRAQRALASSEEQLRQAQKLEAVGRLAGGVAHDFNNLLTVILSYSQEMLEDLPVGAPWRDELEQVERAGRRAADLTRQMLAFSRQQVLEPRVLDINEMLGSVGRMLDRVLGEDIELRVRPTSAIGKVLIDPGQIEQVLMNLVLNARDAMAQGGQLTIETRAVDLDEAYAREHLEVVPGAYVMLAITDTGVGMDRETQARIFEPFFTTKDRGKGTGLGLSTVFGIVKQSAGHIWLYSEPGCGTTFKIYLPAVDGRASALQPTSPLSGLRQGTETVLLAEDDEQIRLIAERYLARAGYRVLAAATPLQAIELCRRCPGVIHLLLTDVVMPKMSGSRLAKEVVELRPTIRVLFMSGYTDDAIFHHGVLDSGLAFIQKPLTPDALIRKVREVLDGPAPAPTGLLG